MDEIKAFLALPDDEKTYEQAFLLYRKYGKNPNLIRNHVIEQRNSRPVLIYELDKLYQLEIKRAEQAAQFEATRKAAAEKIAAEKAEAERLAAEKEAAEDAVNAELNQTLVERSRLIGQRARLQNTLADLATDEERAARILEIDGITAQIDALTGGIAAEKFPIPGSLGEIKDELQKSRVRLSKHEKLVKDQPESPLLGKWEAKIAYETEYCARLVAARDELAKSEA